MMMANDQRGLDDGELKIPAKHSEGSDGALTAPEGGGEGGEW